MNSTGNEEGLPEKWKYLEDIDHRLNLIYPLVLISFGSVGNLITFYIYTRKCFKNTSIGFYYSCLAIVDTLALCIGSSKFYLNAIDLVNLSTYSLFTCKVFTSSIYILAQYSAWIIVLANVDRLILVTSNRLANKNTRSKKFHLFLLTALFMIILAINMPQIIFLKITKEYLLNEHNSFEPFVSCELDNSTFYNNNVADITDLFVFLLIPFIIMIISSLIITWTIFKSKVKLKKYSRTNILLANSKKKKKKELHFSLTILGTNILFLLLNLPICLILVIRNFHRQDEVYYGTRLKLDLAFTIANIFAYFNFSNSIIVHALLNQIFRNRLKKMLGCTSDTNL